MKITITIIGFILALVLAGCRSQYTKQINLYVDENVVSEEVREKNTAAVSVTNRHHIHDTFQATVSTHQGYARSNVYDIDSQENFVTVNKNTQKNDISDAIDLMMHGDVKQDSGKSYIFTSDFLVNFPMTYDSLQHISDLNQKIQTQVLVIDSLGRTIHDLQTSINKQTETDAADSAFKSHADGSQNDSTAIKHSPQESVSTSLRDHQQHLLQAVQKTDTIHINREVNEAPSSDGNTKFSALHQDLNVKNDTVEQPARQLIIQQQPKADTAAIVKEVNVPPSKNDEANFSVLQQDLSVKKDTEERPERQLMLQQQHRTDTDTIEKEVPELPVKDEDTKSSVLHQDLNVKNDTIQQLSGQAKNMQLPVQRTDTVFAIKELLVTEQEEIHSVLITAYYSMGKTIPEDEDTVLKQIRNIAENETIEKVILSGYSDSPEDSTINNRLTAARLDYMNEKIQSYISADKIHLQNLGDSIESDTIINEERCLEIRIFFLGTGNSSF